MNPMLISKPWVAEGAIDHVSVMFKVRLAKTMPHQIELVISINPAAKNARRWGAANSQIHLHLALSSGRLAAVPGVVMTQSSYVSPKPDASSLGSGTEKENDLGQARLN
ncbi:hypothetical protein [Rhodoferax sp.]|uniref:hypothetical protein n=1 Tax=Rhodoferax sp. TaxID=50421 RepID=UPI0025CE548D|nr:hypothetical protein [Rhodoferax sp.]